MNSTSDDLIQKVLTNLRDTEAPTGLEHRIHSALATHNSNLTSQNWKQKLAISTWFWPLTATTAAAAILIIALPSHRSNTSSSTTANAPPAPLTIPVPLTSEGHTPPTTPERQRPALSQPRTTPWVSAETNFAGLKARPNSPSETTDLATLETRAPSLAAPIAPLSAEERRLQRVFYRADPQDTLAELTIPSPPHTAISALAAGFAPSATDTETTTPAASDTLDPGDDTGNNQP